MSKTQIQQLIVLLLLIGFAGFWFYSKKVATPITNATGTTAGTQQTRDDMKRAAQEILETTFQEFRIRTISVKRNPFEPAQGLQDLVNEKKRQAELAAMPEPEIIEIEPIIPEVAPVIIQPPLLELQGISWSSKNPLAIVNRQVLGIGEEVEGAKITAISRQKIKVTYEGQEFEFELPDKGSANNNNSQNNLYDPRGPGIPY